MKLKRQNLPKVSVVIPTYNEEKYLKEALESILNQTFKVYEIIIVDSNSKDNTREIAKEFCVRVLNIKERGVSRARHIGAEKSKGDIIIHTSADIKADKKWVESLIKPILSNKSDLTFGSVYLKDPDFFERCFSFLLNNFFTPILFKFGIIFATADNIASLKNFYFDIGGFNIKLKTGEDTDLIKRACKKGRVLYVKEAKIFTDSRRIRKWGKFKYFSFHLKNFIQTNFFGKTEKEYEAVR